MQLLLVALGGALGSVARFLIARAMVAYAPAFPLGTLLVNVAGCFGIGIAAHFVERQGSPLSPDAWALAVVGFLGGFTTFSAFGHETVLLWRATPIVAAANVVVQVTLGLAAVAAGRAVARLI